MAEIIHGKTTGDSLSVIADKTQVYGLKGNDTLSSVDKSDVLLIGGSGDDVLKMTGGNGTLSGGAGSDTFKLTYSADKPLSAVIEDLEPTSDKIVIDFVGNATPQLTSIASGNDVIWSDAQGYFNLTLKGSSDASDYYDDAGNDNIWAILQLVNQEREAQSLSWLTLSDALTEGAGIRSTEIIDTYSHTRPDGTSCFTVVTKSYWSLGENIYSSPSSPEAAMVGWMNSSGHRANILNTNYNKLGIGYTYATDSQWKYHWVQLFGGGLTNPDTLSTAAILTAQMTIGTITADEMDTPPANPNLLALTEGDDTYSNSLEGATIQGLGGDDTIYNSGAGVSIDSGEGNDSIANYKSNVTIGGGAGDDSIYNNWNFSTNKAFTDSDGSNVLFQYDGDGNDFIGGFKADSTLRIGDGTGFYSSVVSGSDILIAVGAGTITLNDAATLDTLNILGTEITETVDSKLITLTEGDDVYSNSLDGATLLALGGNDSIYNSGASVSIDAGDGNDFIGGFKADSTLRIGDGTDNATFLDHNTTSPLNVQVAQTEAALMVTNKTANTIIAGTTYDDNIVNRAKNVTVTGNAGNDCLSTIRKTSNVKLYGDAGDDVLEAYSSTKVLLDGGEGDDDIHVSGGSNNTIVGGTGDDTIEIENATGTVIKYKSGDGNDVIEGFNETTTLLIGDGTGTYSISQNGDDIIIKAGSGQITLKGSASWLTYDEENPPEENIKGKFVPDGDVLYLDDKSPANVTIDDYVEIVDATARTKKPIKIVGNDIDNSIVGSANKNSIYGSEGNDTLVGGKVADILDGGADDDMLWGQSGNDTLTGGAGEDLFIYTAGKDVITDYTVDEDRIQISSKWTKSSIKGSDVVLTYGSSKTLTIKDGKFKEILFVDADGNETSAKFGVTVLKKSNYTATETDEYIDGTAWKKNATITGNDLDNTILGGAKNDTIYGEVGADSLVGGKGKDKLYGGYDDDTLYGGAGNDTLWGGDGADVFIYNKGDGKDVIIGFDEDDALQLTGVSVSDIIAIESTTAVVLTIDSKNSITFKKSTTDTYNINDDFYTISDSKLIKK